MNKSLPPKTSFNLSTSKQFPIVPGIKELYLYNSRQRSEYIKLNPKTRDKCYFDRFFDCPRPQRTHLLERITNATQLYFPINSRTPEETIFLLSKLKDLQYLKLLSLEFEENRFSEPYFLKYLSIVLSHLKKLTSFQFTFPSGIGFFPGLLSSLFFAIPRMTSLKHLSLYFDYASSHDNPNWLISLSSYLEKCYHLKSLNLTFHSCCSIGNSILSLLAPIFKKLVSLQTLDICLSEFESLKNDDILKFFTSLKDSKSIKNLALSLKSSMLSPTSPEPISKGLCLLNPSQLKSLKLIYYLGLDDLLLEHLVIALQRFISLQELSLDLSGDSRISDDGLNSLVSSLQTLQSLCSLNINVYRAIQLRSSVKIIGNAVKTLVNLTDLSVDFAGQRGVDDGQFISFSENLKNLSVLKQLNLSFNRVQEITDSGLSAFSESLGYFTNLSSLKLGFVDMNMLTNFGVSKLFLSLKNLKNLANLSLNLTRNKNLYKETIDSLAEAVQGILCLKTVKLDFSSCSSLKEKEGCFTLIFYVLGKLESLREILVRLPKSPVNEFDAQKYLKRFREKVVNWDYESLFCDLYNESL